MKKSVLALALAGVLTVGGSVLAFADEAAVITGFRHKGTTGVQTLMDGGLSFEEAKAERLEQNYARVDAAVERGIITADEGAAIKAEMESNSAACTTPGENQGTHEGYGLNQGLGGNGIGQGAGHGRGNGGGRGARMGLGDSSCIND